MRLTTPKSVIAPLLLFLSIGPAGAQSGGTLDVMVRGDLSELPAAVRLDVRPSDSALQETITAEALEILSDKGVQVVSSAEWVFVITLSAGGSGLETPTSGVEVGGRGGDSSRREYRVSTNLTRSDPAESSKTASVSMILYQPGKAPVWSGAAVRRTGAPLQTDEWLDMSAALLERLGETIDP